MRHRILIGQVSSPGRAVGMLRRCSDSPDSIDYAVSVLERSRPEHCIPVLQAMLPRSPNDAPPPSLLCSLSLRSTVRSLLFIALSGTLGPVMEPPLARACRQVLHRASQGTHADGAHDATEARAPTVDDIADAVSVLESRPALATHGSIDASHCGAVPVDGIVSACGVLKAAAGSP